ncbi:MAG TPA: hypothetical protein VMK16_07965, partial [Acidimicrobiales bacterium]|nr:hypothetical protein [Acidimicrobiales bacterium]
VGFAVVVVGFAVVVVGFAVVVVGFAVVVVGFAVVVVTHAVVVGFGSDGSASSADVEVGDAAATVEPGVAGPNTNSGGVAEGAVEFGAAR